MRIVAAGVVSASVGVVGLATATQTVAAIFAYQPALGDALLRVGGTPVYWPWKVLAWDQRWAELHPRPFALARAIAWFGLAVAFLSAALVLKPAPAVKPFGRKAWGTFRDAVDADLFAPHGTVLGKLDGEILCFDGPEHQILIGASRTGKGRGHVVPTLLAWPASALVLDIKSELADGDARVGFPGTAGFREKLGTVLRFAPTRPDSAAFNPLMEVRRGPNEVRDVQNIVEILVDPAGAGRNQDFWDRSAKQVIVGVVLHVLYAEPVKRKSLAVVREKLRDLDAAALQMLTTLHRLSPATGQPEVHPEVRHAAESYLAGEERLQSGVKATAESFFGLFADEIVASRTATSDFRIGDLMCLTAPVTLYLQPPPSDASRLMPLLRLLINQIARALMEDQGHDAQGRAKRHRLLFVLDEFPMLGRIPFFETMMGAMAGYGLKAFLVCQSLNHIVRAYGRDNVILDNCHIVTSFAAADTDTARRIAEMAGEVYEIRESETRRRPRPLIGLGAGSTSLREERRPLLLPGDVRALKRDEQLIFVAGARPLRTKKLKFDQERRFAERVCASSRSPAQLTTTHDWLEVRPLGVCALPEAGPAAKAAAKAKAQGAPGKAAADTSTKGKADRARPVFKAPLAKQRHLFDELGARPSSPTPLKDVSHGGQGSQKLSLSEQASAGFRDEAGAPLPHPDDARPVPPPAPYAPPRRRPEGM